MSGVRNPVLWHLGASHYSEKVRWALAHKRIEHRRRTAPPGAHVAVALWLSRGQARTFPLLELGGETIPDSTAIIAALEERCPEPPLYPGDPIERRRALELEDWFDEHAGPAARLLAWHMVLRDPRSMGEIGSRSLPPRLRSVGAARSAVARLVSLTAELRYGVRDAGAATEAHGRVLAVFDRIEEELGGGDYLVGDRFTVADLTAAALLYPLVMPEEGPRLPLLPPELASFQAEARERSAYRWVEEMFRRHRRR